MNMHVPAASLKHRAFSRPSSYLFKDSGYLILLDSSSNVPAFGAYFKYSIEHNDFYLPQEITQKMFYQKPRKQLNNTKQKLQPWMKHRRRRLAVLKNYLP